MKVAFCTLGCKVNQYETQAMERILTERGHSLGSFDESCDCYIINTCTVTATGDKKSRNAVRRARKRNPAAVVGVCGCYAQLQPEEVAALGADVVSGSAQRVQFLDLLEQAFRERRPVIAVDEALQRRAFELLPAGGLSGRTRAMLKVQDGCRNFCSYCIIPYARGPVRSAPEADAVAQARALADAGYRELVITGIEISSWGVDLPGSPPLHQLTAAVCAAVPELRVRLGSLEPRTVTEDFCRALSAWGNLCPQFHLSLQSGCDTVLQRMRRRYDTARYLESVRLLRAYFPGCAVTTDLIVGFPGETEAEHAASVAFLEQAGFAAVHVFPYSRRSGTPAARMPGQIPNAVKQRRAQEAGLAAARLSRAYREALVGTVQPVLLEQPDGDWYTGHAPNYIKVYVPGGGVSRNQVLPVRITGLMPDGVAGEPV